MVHRCHVMYLTGAGRYLVRVTTAPLAVRYAQVPLRAMVCLSAIAILNSPSILSAQQPLTRSEAIRLALGASARVSSISADTLAADARLRTAREYPNPTFTASYSRAVPQNHFSVELPLDLPGIRGSRVSAAEAGRTSARYSFLAARAAIELGVDTMYSVAEGAVIKASLSRATAIDAARMLTDTRLRRDAGDASDLDVNLAEVSAGQAANIASADSVGAIDTRLELQSRMGLRGDIVVVELADSLGSPGRVTGVSVAQLASAPSVAAASAAVTAARLGLVSQRRSAFGVPAVQFGVEARDPTGGEKGALPTVGIVLPLPLFNRSGGAVAFARAEVTRAQAELAVARLEASTQLSRAIRTWSVAEARIARDRRILDAATSNLTLSEKGYAEGQLAISDILEVRRALHDAQAQYVTDLVAANVGAALVRVFTENGISQ